ncbi:calreticulin-3 isoform X2 [Hippopotamus amphibius kiboko]|uniref:calreticulin-3 isoform X2 n=1 Tax=Hippopotamus amphibius kiboko TaxID=575201 RepID=UPI0025942721|nr:calreticulin-3 isoform X2 [Hippopotamus amphibius kiboko]
MAAARVPLWAVCVLRVALATVYFQEEFLDGERWRNRWVQSTNDSQFGYFRLSSGKFYGHKEKDKGPDICGFDIKKVHVILHFKNQYHSNKKSIRCKVDGFTHLYTLTLRPDLTYDVKIDGQSIESGSIEYDWQLTSLKKMEKPSAESKDWDQATEDKSQDWEKHFLDARASKPSDWNSELDGDWQAPMLQKPPYQDGLKPEGIDKDVWLHQKMKNTNYLMEYDLSEFENIGAIGLELWQVRSGTIFDNFLITDDEQYAEDFGKATWGETKGPEREMDDIQAKEEVKKAREEDEDELLMGRFGGRENNFKSFHRRNEL